MTLPFEGWSTRSSLSYCHCSTRAVSSSMAFSRAIALVACRHQTRTLVTRVRLESISLTLSTPTVPNCCCSKDSMPYWSNPPF